MNRKVRKWLIINPGTLRFMDRRTRFADGTIRLLTSAGMIDPGYRHSPVSVKAAQ